MIERWLTKVTEWLGRPCALIGAFVTVVVWGTVGPLFGFSETWQLVINTGTTIVTFLMIFVVQNTQNRETRAMHTKLDLLLVDQVAEVTSDHELLKAEEKPEEEIKQMQGDIVDEGE